MKPSGRAGTVSAEPSAATAAVRSLPNASQEDPVLNNPVDQSNQYNDEEECAALIRRSIAGDQSAASTLFHAYRDMVYRVVYKLLGPSGDTDDVVQQTFIELFRTLPYFEGRSKFTTWIYRIAVNVATQCLRKRHSRRAALVEGGAGIDPDRFADPGSMARAEVSERRELRERIMRALDSLHLRKRAVVVLHDMEGRTMEEIAEIVGVPVGTVKSRLFHGREELKKKLRKELDVHG